jgi:hypothetical protein
MINNDWIDELTNDIARKYRVVLENDDPVLITAVLNKELLSKAQSEYESLFVKNSKLLHQQLKAQQLSNEVLLSKVCDRLIAEVHTVKKLTSTDNQHTVSDTKIQIGKLILLSLLFMFGLVIGILLVKVI